jgi:uncharacterized protein
VVDPRGSRGGFVGIDQYATLDNQAIRTAAITDPAGFVATLKTPVAIDEIPRVPELITEIKLRVDRDKTPGQFALTGSANLLEMTRVKDSLAGRAEYLRLHPFSQGELRGHREAFVPGLASGRFPNVTDAPVGRKAYAEILARGGYPEIQGRALGTPATTIRRHIELLEMLFLLRRLPAWSNNLLARSVKRPKVHVADTGLLAYLAGADERRIETDLDLGGMFYETFVAMELHRQISWLDDRPQLFHFRDRDQREVDIVIEHRDGSISAVEVKAAATVHLRDFRGLKHLRDKLGNRFKAGALLYTGANTVYFGDRLAAVPLSGLWAA